ncbi:MAG: adenine phosphoribosyltransferase [Firmicutes bacterium]|nr:adenine phosphoribosyltransferase [Bacillota bacterium]
MDLNAGKGVFKLYDHLKEKIRNIPDFPIPGIMFKDITTLLKDGQAFSEVIEGLVNRYQDKGIDVVVAIESRGYIFGAPLAAALKVGFVPVRKLGKLPAETIKTEYQTEYSKEIIEMHRDAIQPGQKVLVIDDLVATGGSAAAVKELVEQLGGQVVEFAFVVELTFLNGREKLAGYPVFSMINF